ncbi:MAG TPA: winged helix-turn-helix transcriptional regulator [Nitrososphaeraceae archaeon]|jgi:Lrp/AsnC family leucine-responsive transcriptional regulator|nr:winged helix-turn-helix transcriptional regulator [Nitrososphaeraceae archaeon]
MPFPLDDYDVAVLNALIKDGRKSFREISRETGITAPTVKARFQRLVNTGLIKSISPIFDFGIIENDLPGIEEVRKEYSHRYSQQMRDTRSRIRKGIKIKLDCEFCEGPIEGHPHIFKFADFERFFCCAVCLSAYKQKYGGRIESIKRKFEKRESEV